MLDFWLTGFNLSNELLFLFIYFFSSSVFSFVYLWALVVAWPPGQGPASKEHWAWFPWCRVPALSERRKVCHVLPWKVDINPNLRCCGPKRKLQPAIEAPLHQTATHPQPV